MEIIYLPALSALLAINVIIGHSWSLIVEQQLLKQMLTSAVALHACPNNSAHFPFRVSATVPSAPSARIFVRCRRPTKSWPLFHLMSLHKKVGSDQGPSIHRLRLPIACQNVTSSKLAASLASGS